MMTNVHYKSTGTDGPRPLEPHEFGVNESGTVCIRYRDKLIKMKDTDIRVLPFKESNSTCTILSHLFLTEVTINLRSQLTRSQMRSGKIYSRSVPTSIRDLYIVDGSDNTLMHLGRNELISNDDPPVGIGVFYELKSLKLEGCTESLRSVLG